MKRIIETARMREVWDSGSGPLPHEIRCRLLDNNGQANYLEISRKGKDLPPVLVPELNPLDLPLYLTSVIGSNLPELSDAELARQARELLEHLPPSSLPAVTICFGPRREAQHARQLHFSREECSVVRSGANLKLTGLSGDTRPPLYLRKWTCLINFANSDEAERMDLLIFLKAAPVIAFDETTFNIRAHNPATWLSVGFSSEVIQKYAAAEGVRLERLLDPDGTTLAFRAGPMQPKSV